MTLTKKFRLIWNAALVIKVNDEFNLPSQTGVPSIFTSFEADTKEEINAKILELGLTEAE